MEIMIKIIKEIGFYLLILGYGIFILYVTKKYEFIFDLYNIILQIVKNIQLSRFVLFLFILALPEGLLIWIYRKVFNC